VVVHLDKSVEEAASLLAISRAGGIFVDANLQLRSPQLRHILIDSGARLLIVSAARLPTIAGALEGLDDQVRVILVGAQPEADAGHTAWQGLVESGDPGFGEVRRIDVDPAGIIYTSGSTGAPKGVVVSHRNLVAGAESVSEYLENTPQDVVLSVLPFSFDYGLNQLTTTLLVGMRLVLQRYVGPADILAAARRHAITGLAGIPPIWTSLAELDWSQDAPFAHLRYITNSGGAFPPSLVDRYRARLPRTRLFLMYGLTEAFRATYLPPEAIDERPGSIGKAIPNAEILLLDDSGAPCAPGQIGQIVQRGAHVASERRGERGPPPSPSAAISSRAASAASRSSARLAKTRSGYGHAGTWAPLTQMCSR
jgi:acyl-CoA synthetase (AMP-forming)/AMP-acid ligase II